MNEEIALEYDFYIEAAKIDPEKNEQEILRKLKYDGKTVQIQGIDGKPYRCKVSIKPYDYLSNGLTGMTAMRREIYANQTPNGEPYIRIPPHMLKQVPISKFMPIFEHEAEHVRQILNKKKYGSKSNPNEMTYLEARDKKAVIEYAKEYIEKHPIALNNGHDNLEYELLADFHSAIKYGIKSYKKALRSLAYRNGSYKKMKKSLENTLADASSPTLKLYEKGERKPGPYIKELELYNKKLKYVLKNAQITQKNNKENTQTMTTKSPILGNQEVKANEQTEAIVNQVQATIQTNDECIKKLKSQNPRADLPDDFFGILKITSASKKLATSFPAVISSFATMILATEYRLKFLDKIMKDKPWLKDKDAKYRTVYESYILPEFDIWEPDESLIQEAFEDDDEVLIEW